MEIIKATANDSNHLTDLTFRSKAYWGYNAEQMEEWRDELTVSKEFIADHHVYKLEEGRSMLGFYGYFYESSSTIKLEFLFVDPDYIGKGYGKLLFNDFLQRIEGSQASRIILDADPNAAKFYSKIGFVTIGKLPTSIKDRYLPIMELKLKEIQL